MSRKAALVLVTCSIAFLAAQADVLLTRDGARLTGEITLIDGGIIHLETSYAGAIEVSQEEVLSFISDREMTVRLEDGTVFPASPEQALDSGVAAVWPSGQPDPDVWRAETDWERSQMSWSVRTAFDVSGLEGSNEEFNLGASVRATLANHEHAITVHGLYDERSRNGQKTEDRIVGGAGYENFFSEVLGWYVRSELERDKVDRIDLRSTSNGGLSYRIIGEEHHLLVLRSGFGYRYTDFSGDISSEADPTLDPALAHLYRFGTHYLVQTDLRYVPSIKDFGAYQITQDTGVEIPVGESAGFKLRFGLRNRYDSQTATDDALETSYYTQLVVDWQ